MRCCRTRGVLHFALRRARLNTVTEMMDNLEVRFGSSSEWKAFASRHERFLQHFGTLRTAFENVFLRTIESSKPIDLFVFIAGRLAVDDFLEILLVCGNAEASAANKILRPMFERLVTLMYLHKHPEEVDAYLDYYWVSQHKLITAINKTFPSAQLDEEKVRETEQRFREVKGKYSMTLCKVCKSERPTVSWTPKDMVTMATEVGLGDLVVPAYYLPMQHTHPTVKGMLERLEDEEATGGLSVGERLDPESCDRSLATAHLLLLHAIDTQLDHFGLDPGQYEALVAEYSAIWQKPGPSRAYNASD